VRRFWRGDGGQVSEFATRLAGSSDLYESSGRRPYASINFVTAHDGFSLNDLVSYNDKHNEANGDNNRDGDDHNNSWNCGVEGPTDDANINALRTRQKRNFLATLLLSQGVPMICGGDEIGRTQGGNNNGYCQDNETSWFNWNLTHEQTDLLNFCRHLLRLTRKHPVFRRRNFFQGRRIRGAEVKDLTWFEPAGQEMTDETWNADFIRSLMVRLDGESMDETDEEGHRLVDDTFLLLMNADRDAVQFTLPAHRLELPWVRVLDTSESDWGRTAVLRGNRYRVRSWSMVVFRSRAHARASLPADNNNHDTV
jgi:glycogen operon protein